MKDQEYEEEEKKDSSKTSYNKITVKELEAILDIIGDAEPTPDREFKLHLVDLAILDDFDTAMQKHIKEI